MYLGAIEFDIEGSVAMDCDFLLDEPLTEFDSYYRESGVESLMTVKSVVACSFPDIGFAPSSLRKIRPEWKGECEFDLTSFIWAMRSGKFWFYRGDMLEKVFGCDTAGLVFENDMYIPLCCDGSIVSVNVTVFGRGGAPLCTVHAGPRLALTPPLNPGVTYGGPGTTFHAIGAFKGQGVLEDGVVFQSHEYPSTHMPNNVFHSSVLTVLDFLDDPGKKMSLDTNVAVLLQMLCHAGVVYRVEGVWRLNTHGDVSMVQGTVNVLVRKWLDLALVNSPRKSWNRLAQLTSGKDHGVPIVKVCVCRHYYTTDRCLRCSLNPKVTISPPPSYSRQTILTLPIATGSYFLSTMRPPEYMHVAKCIVTKYGYHMVTATHKKPLVSIGIPLNPAARSYWYANNLVLCQKKNELISRHPVRFPIYYPNIADLGVTNGTGYSYEQISNLTRGYDRDYSDIINRGVGTICEIEREGLRKLYASFAACFVYPVQFKTREKLKFEFLLPPRDPRQLIVEGSEFEIVVVPPPNIARLIQGEPDD